MKTLVLIRHAKAEDATSIKHDYDRPLSAKGIKDATKMGKLLFKKVMQPDVIICSSANRTKATAELFALALSYDQDDVKERKQLYNADYKTLLNEVYDQKTCNSVVVLVAHNPGISDLLNYLCDISEVFSPSSFAVITFEKNDWKMARKGIGTLISLEINH